MPCLAFAVLLVGSPEGRRALFVRRTDPHGLGQPSLALEAATLLVLEDVDLVAQERTFGPMGSSPVLYELMNAHRALRARPRSRARRRRGRRAADERREASFVKELLRRAAVLAAEAGRTTVGDEDVQAVLDDLVAESSQLTRVLLGGERGVGGSVPGPHEWLGASAQVVLEASDEG